VMNASRLLRSRKAGVRHESDRFVGMQASRGNPSVADALG
jgi:hypothetical protein